MAYTEAGTHLNFFVPNIPLSLNAAEVLKEIDVGAASADLGELVCIRPCKVTQVLCVVTGEAISGTSVDPRVVFTKRPTPLSATGEAVVETVILPSGTAIGKVVYEDVATPVAFAVGDSMEISHVIGTGTPTGMVVYGFICIENPETPANNSDMIASA